MSLPQDEFPIDPREDDSAALAYLAEERQSRSAEIIYNALMHGAISEDNARHLCFECSIPFSDVRNFKQHVLRPLGEPSTLDLDLPF